MAKDRLEFARSFQVWSYTVGHSRLLLRSVKSIENSTRVDVLFKNVASISMPTLVENLTIEAADENTRRMLVEGWELRILEGRVIFVLRGTNYQGYVVAGAMAHHEDDGEYDEPSQLMEVAR